MPTRKKNAAAVALGRKGGKIGGKRRAETLTPAQLSAIGRKGAAARWYPVDAAGRKKAPPKGRTAGASPPEGRPA